jgi:hypothetical protein
MKLQLIFHPESDLTEVSQHVAEYEKLWSKYGDDIISSLEKTSGFKFRETFIHVNVSDFISYSHPMNLRTYPNIDSKLSAMTHELAHRVMFKHIKGMGKQNSLVKHKTLFLFLYDTFLELYGEEFLQKTIAFDSGLNNDFVEAWKFVSGLNKEGRSDLFGKLKIEGAEIFNN